MGTKKRWKNEGKYHANVMCEENLCRTMALGVWKVCIGGMLLLGLCRAGPSCPSPCFCPPATLTCRGCPSDYLVLSNDTQLLSVTDCKDIQYFLKLHRSHLESERHEQYVLHKLEITDSLMDKIPPSYIDNEYPIQSLNFSNNLINSIDPGLEAENLTHLDLSRNRLSFVENRTFYRMNNILYLDLSGNSITNLSVDCFYGLGKLAHLDISQNNLTYLMDTTFVPLTSLQQLNLSYNMLEALSEKCFGNLLLLQQLDVSYNRLTSVAPGTLQFLPNLANLLLADNPQLKPDAQIFVGTGRRLQQVDASRTGLRRVPEALTHSVRYLRLAGNRISTLRCGDLDGYPLLHMLDFADNVMEYVEDDALGRLEMISSLFLNKNKLRAVPKMLPDKLSYLSLDNNLIENLTIIDFATLTNLKVLILSNNVISYIRENAFTQLISLEILDVSNNPLKTLTPNTFSGPLSLKNLHISFVKISPPAKDISFPVPFPEGIENLYLEHSPGLTRELLADTAALAAMTRLQFLDISFSNVTTIRSDLLHFLPQLKSLRLKGNEINCTDLNWLSEWMRENINDEYKEIQCFTPPSMKGSLVIDLPPPMKRNTGDIFTKQDTQTNKKYLDNTQTKIRETFEFGNESMRSNTISDVGKKLKSNFTYSDSNKETEEHLKKIFFTQIVNASNTANINRMNRINGNYQVKSLLDFQFDDQHHMNFKIPKKNYTQTQRKYDATTEKPRILVSVKKPSLFINSNLDHDDATSDSRVSSSKKINKLLAVKTPHVDFNDKNDLIEIFSQLSQPHNNSNISNMAQKINQTTQVSVPPCTTNGNLNGTENKTKCYQQSEIAPEFSENNENKNIKTGRFIYRKNGYAKSGNTTKPRKYKFISRPIDGYNASKLLKQHHLTNTNETTIKTIQLNNLTDLSESQRPFVSGQNARSDQTTSETTPHGDQINSTTRVKINRAREHPNATIKTMQDVMSKYVDATNGKALLVEDLQQGVENVSEYQTSKYRAEQNVGLSAPGVGMLIAAVAAVCAALVGAVLVTRRPLNRRPRAPEIMEVQTISAVGDLW